MRKALTQQRLHEQRNAFGRRCAVERAVVATAREAEGTHEAPGGEKRAATGLDGALPAHGSRDGVSQDFSAQGARVLRRRCGRGHVWLLSRLEAEAARVLPPCPECVREDAESVARHWARVASGGAS